MIRLIMVNVRDCGGEPVRKHLTIDAPAPAVEAALRQGGRSADGFHVISLIGAEDLDPGTRFILETAYSQDGYVYKGYTTIDMENLDLGEWGTVIGAEVLS